MCVCLLGRALLAVFLVCVNASLGCASVLVILTISFFSSLHISSLPVCVCPYIVVLGARVHACVCACSFLFLYTVSVFNAVSVSVCCLCLCLLSLSLFVVSVSVCPYAQLELSTTREGKLKEQVQVLRLRTASPFLHTCARSLFLSLSLAL